MPAAGLIPAGAGNILLQIALSVGIRAHPRGCGEHIVTFGVVIRNPGSSPRVRGTCYQYLNQVRPVGLIPAGAGNIRRRA